LHLRTFGFSGGEKEMKRQAFSSREAVETFLLEMWARMDSGQLFSVFNEWMKRPEYVIESGGECHTKQKRFALIACLFAKIERRSTTFQPSYILNGGLAIIVFWDPESIFLTWLPCNMMQEDWVKSRPVRFSGAVVLERGSADKIVTQGSVI
jgi:hypothetical protein